MKRGSYCIPFQTEGKMLIGVYEEFFNPKLLEWIAIHKEITDPAVQGIDRNQLFMTLIDIHEDPHTYLALLHRVSGK